MFVLKVRAILDTEDPSIICWCNAGVDFKVCDVSLFCEEVLPKYFKHKKMSSFIRQLNNFGFKRSFTNADKKAKEMVFEHPFFQKDNVEIQSLITKMPRKQWNFITVKSKSQQQLLPAVVKDEEEDAISQDIKEVFTKTEIPFPAPLIDAQYLQSCDYKCVCVCHLNM